MSRTPSMIRTPDQRLRVFVSSTLQELAPERQAARSAIGRLHLSPVLFELGARPHPPRELYRAYLAQSHLFVGIYWQRYGWVAPGESVSGLEDEYRLVGDKPKLIYVKTPSPEREARLEALLARIREDDTASYKPFATAKELRTLLTDDLALLLSERFEGVNTADRAASGPEDGETASSFPAPLTGLIGREREVRAVQELLLRDDVRLVTLTGPGGIGKSRLSLAVVSGLDKPFRDGARFVDLAAIQEPALVLSAVAQVLRVRNTGERPLVDTLKEVLRERQMLLVLDNFEQVLDAAPGVAELLTGAPGVKLLVTSRALLQLSGEHSFEVGPLSLPDPKQRASLGDLRRYEAVQLFVERARAVQPDFDLSSENAEAVAKICLALDGVPLAIELAAARVRLLRPQALLARLDRRLPLLEGGAKNLPARQRTLRRTIEWSTQLLSAEERALLERLGVFAGGFTLEAAEAVCGEASPDPLGELEALVNNSLVRQEEWAHTSRFTMLATVREYAREQLEVRGELERTRQRHADYYLALAQRAGPELRGPQQGVWAGLLEAEHDNLRAALRFYLDTKDFITAAGFAWTLYLFWWVRGHLGEVRRWMEEVLAADAPLSPLARAQALYFTRAITFWQDQNEWVVPGLEESAGLFRQENDPSGTALALVSLALALLAAPSPDPARADAALEESLSLFREAGDRWGEAMALTTLGRLALLSGHPQRAYNRFEESLALTRLQGDELSETIALHHLGWAAVVLGHPDRAKASFEKNLGLSARLGHDEGVAYGLEGLVAVAAGQGEVERAARLLGAAEAQRTQTGSYNAPTFSFHQRALDGLLTPANQAAFDAARALGHALPLEEAVAYALSTPSFPIPGGEIPRST